MTPGCKELPIEKGADGKSELHYTGIYKLFADWADDGSLKKAFIASVKHLSEENKLDLSLLHGDGSNTVAKKGATESATAACLQRRDETEHRRKPTQSQKTKAWPQTLF